MTSIHAVVPKSLRAVVNEAQSRGQESAQEVSDEAVVRDGNTREPAAAVRRRGPIARQRGTAAPRRSDGSPTGGFVRRRPQPAPNQPFVVQTGNDDVFNMSRLTQPEISRSVEEDDSSMMDADQENDESRSPTKAKTPKATTPRRPLGAAVPLGELTLDEPSPDSTDDELEPEYPPSPRKSPMKSPAKHLPQPIFSTETADRPESSRAAAQRAPNITPPSNAFSKPLAEHSPFTTSINPSPSPRKTRVRPQTPGSGRGPLFPSLATPQKYAGIFKATSPSSSEKKRQEAKRRAELDAKLWNLCGRDIRRWNVGDFDGEPFLKKARRW